MFNWLFGSKDNSKDDSDSDDSSQQNKTTGFATREEALAAAKREIDLLILIKKENERNGRK